MEAELAAEEKENHRFIKAGCRQRRKLWIFFL